MPELPALRPFDINPALAAFDSGIATRSRLADMAYQREARGRERSGYNAVQEAGNLLASGDRAGAESALMRAGKINEAFAVREQGVKEDERAKAKKLEMTDKLLGAVYGVDDPQEYTRVITSFATEHGMDPARLLAENKFEDREANIRELAGFTKLQEMEAKRAESAGREDLQRAQAGYYRAKTDQVNAPAAPALSPGQEATDKAFAKEYVDFNARGGYADVQKNLQQLEGALVKLEGDPARGVKPSPNLTGPTVGNYPDWYSAIGPQGRERINVRESVEEVVQRNLRLVLGAQFTEKEGERLIARAFNPRLSQPENAKRVRRLIDAIKGAADAKRSASEYFAQNGTLRGWSGQLPTAADFDRVLDDTSGDVETGSVGPQPGAVEDGYRFRGGNPADPNSWEPVR